jgi:hypothetical protein
MDTIGNSLSDVFGTTLGNVIWALIILVVGWVVAVILRSVTTSLLSKTKLDDKLAKLFADAEEDKPVDVDRLGGLLVYYVVLLLVITAFLEQLGLIRVAESLTTFLEQIASYLPSLIAAGLLLLAAWIIATIVRVLLRGVFKAAKLDERIAKQTDADPEAAPSIGDGIAEAVYWLIFVLFIPAILEALKVEGLLAPVQSMLDEVFVYLPNILWAVVIFFAGLFIARVLRRVTVSALAAFGLDKLADRVGASRALGTMTLSGLAGLLVYTLIMLVVLISALDALDIQAISAPAVGMLDTILGAVPGVVGAFIVLLIAYYVGKLVAELVANLLAGFGFDRILVWLKLGDEPAEGERTPSEIVGSLVLLAIMLFAIAGAADLVGFSSLTEYVAMLIAFFTQLVIAVIILAVGLYLASLARDFVRKTGHPQAQFIAQLAWIAVVIFTLALALGQTGISESVVNLAFGLTIGAIAVAVALAFGLGGRDLAAREMEDFVASFKEKNRDTSEE